MSVNKKVIIWLLLAVLVAVEPGVRADRAELTSAVNPRPVANSVHLHVPPATGTDVHPALFPVQQTAPTGGKPFVVPADTPLSRVRYKQWETWGDQQTVSSETSSSREL
jgi:hypothetical protein